MQRLITYNFNVKLEYLDEYKYNHQKHYYIVPFQVLAKSFGEAEAMLKEWLENPKQTGWKYKTWLSIRPIESNSIIVQDKINVNDYMDN